MLSVALSHCAYKQFGCTAEVTGGIFVLFLTFHDEHTTAEVFEVDPTMRVGVQTLSQPRHLWRRTENISAPAQ